MKDRLQKTKKKDIESDNDTKIDKSVKNDTAMVATRNGGDLEDSKDENENKTIVTEEATIKAKNKKGMFKIKVYVIKRLKKKCKLKCHNVTRYMRLLEVEQTMKFRTISYSPGYAAYVALILF